MTTEPPIEWVPVPDIFVEELVHLERLGSNRRLTFTVRQSLEYDSRVSKVVVAKLIVPAEALAAIAAMLLQDVQTAGAVPMPAHELKH